MIGALLCPTGQHTQAVATTLRRLWASITLADLDTDIKATVDAYMDERLERQRLESLLGGP